MDCVLKGFGAPAGVKIDNIFMFYHDYIVTIKIKKMLYVLRQDKSSVGIGNWS